MKLDLPVFFESWSWGLFPWASVTANLMVVEVVDDQTDFETGTGLLCSHKWIKKDQKHTETSYGSYAEMLCLHKYVKCWTLEIVAKTMNQYRRKDWACFKANRANISWEYKRLYAVGGDESPIVGELKVLIKDMLWYMRYTKQNRAY